MKITFGISLDSPSYPQLTSGRNALIGEQRCGPLGLLQILETRLGLSGVWEPEPYRVEIYRQRLMAADNGTRFYSRSLKADAQGVAQTLLLWRDELLLSGWDFTADASWPARLMDLSAVESIPPSIVPVVPWGFSERVRAVMSKLPSASLDIAEIRLLDPKNTLGKQWEAIIEKLSASGVAITACEPLLNRASGDLGALQNSLSSGSSMTAKGDGSLLILRGKSDSELSDLLSAWLLKANKADRLFIVPHGERTFDRVLTAFGAPSLGISSYSSLRPILQLLPLLCELLWEPLDPYRLLELLSLPVTPIPRIAGRKLSEAVASSPGIGGKGWKAALKEIEALLLEDTAEGAAKWQWIRETIAEWLETRRYPLAEGVPKEALVELANRIAVWSGGRKLRDEEDDSQLKALAAQSAHLVRLVEGAPESHISQPQMRKLLQMVLGEGQAVGDDAGAGHMPWVTTPEAILAPVQEIFWCGFTRGNAAGYRRSPWQRKEAIQLESHGAMLMDPAVDLARHVSGYERAVYAASERMIFIVPDIENGSSAELHPLYDRLAVLLGDSIRSVEISTSQWLAGDTRLSAVATAPVAPRKVPVPVRFWTHPEHISIPKRENESYSSLESLYDCPYKWVLNYGAKLREGTIQSIGSKSSIMGNLAHRLFEEMFVPGEDCSKWKQASVEQRVNDLLKILLPTEGAVFLLPGHLSEHQTIIRRLKRAAWAMTTHIRENGWRVVGTEHESQGNLGVQAVTGSIDLLLDRPDGSSAVVDLKWGQSKYLRPKLLENRAIQLALYAHMKKTKKKMPHVAYFSLSDAVLIAPDLKAFKSARLAELPAGETLETLIDRMEKTFIFRRAQLDMKKIEVPVEGTTPDPAVVIPIGVLVDSDKLTAPAEFRALVGWEDGNRA